MLQQSTISELSWTIGLLLLILLSTSLWKVLFGQEESKDEVDERLKLVTIRGKPFIGALLDVFPQNFIHRGYHYCQKYRGYNILLPVLKDKIYLLTRFEDIQEAVAKRPKSFHRSEKFKYFTETVGFTYGLFNANGAMWSYMRRFITPSFNANNVHRHLQELWLMSNLWTRKLWESPHQPISMPNKAGDNEATVQVEMTRESMFYTLHVINRVAFGTDIDKEFLQYLYNPDFLNDIQAILTFGIETAMFPFPTVLFPYLPHYSTVYQKAIESNQRLESFARLILEQRKEAISKAAANPQKRADGTAVEHKSTIDILLSKKEITLAQSPELTEKDFEEAIIHNVKTLYLAGGETTSNTISWMIYYLSLPVQQATYLKRLQDQADHFYEKYSSEITTLSTLQLQEGVNPPSFLSLDQVVTSSSATSLEQWLLQGELSDFYYFWKETLRIAPPVISLMTSVDKPYHFARGSDHSFVIRPGEQVSIYLESVLKDPEVFVDPDDFRPDRWNVSLLQKNPEVLAKMEKHFMAFGGGPRVCPGMQLSMFEAIFALVSFVYYYEVELTCPPSEVIKVLGTTVYPNKVPIRLRRRRREKK